MSYAIYPSLTGKAVVVTGGGSGIGAAIVEAFARQGARVSFIDVAEADSRALEARLAECVHAPRFYRCDLRNLDALAAVFADIEATSKTIDVLINNAANDDRHCVDEVTPSYWDERIA